jgi:hypothetical protein
MDLEPLEIEKEKSPLPLKERLAYGFIALAYGFIAVVFSAATLVLAAKALRLF